jgi:hypothetical protein
VSPEILELIGRKFGIAHGIYESLETEIDIHQPGITAGGRPVACRLAPLSGNARRFAKAEGLAKPPPEAILAPWRSGIRRDANGGAS